MVLRHDAALARRALEALQRQTATIITQSAALFEGMTFYVADYHEEEVTITDIEVREPDEPELLEIEDEEARFQVFTTVAFVASVAADDPNTGWYDREEGTIHYMERIHRRVEGDVEVTITGRISNFADNSTTQWSRARTSTTKARTTPSSSCTWTTTTNDRNERARLPRRCRAGAAQLGLAVFVRLVVALIGRTSGRQ
jgi:hypothetical protein